MSERLKDARVHRWLDALQVLLMPLVTLALGFIVTGSLNSRQDRENNFRTYADVLGRREEASTSLRKDMLKSVLDSFVADNAKQSVDPGERIARLELLARNFHDLLNLTPLFNQVRGHIANNDHASLTRIQRLALEVNEQQIGTLSNPGGAVLGDAEVPAERSTTFLNPPNETVVATGQSGDQAGVPRLCLQTGDSPRHFRQFRIEFVDWNPNTDEVQVRLYVSRVLNPAECRNPALDLVANREMDRTFWVGLFDFPMISSSPLTFNERCAVTLMEARPYGLRLNLVYFPASRASVNSVRSYDDMVNDILHTRS